MSKKRIGIFAGSFDPLTNGHVDLLIRSSEIFDEVILLIAVNTSKKTWFTPNERLVLAEKVTKDLPKVRVDMLKDGLIATYFKEANATAMIRGVRNGNDFEYESAIASANEKQYEGFETVIFLASEQYRYLSSSLIKEIAYFDGDIMEMVPVEVEEAMQEKVRELKAQDKSEGEIQ